MIGTLAKELYQYRSLVKALVSRHLSLRYRGSVLGFLWSFLNPLLLMVIYTLVFRYYIRFNEVPNYSVFVFTGLLPWLWFSAVLGEGTASITSSGHLITKSLFPAQVLPFVVVLTNLINFLLSLPLLFIFMWVGGMEFHLTLLFLPVLILIQTVMLAGLSLFLASLNVHLRDVQHIVGNFITFLFFLCPIVYPEKVIPEKFHALLDLNPIGTLIVGYHNVILEGVMPPTFTLAYLSIFSLACVALGSGVYLSRREIFAEAL